MKTPTIKRTSEFIRDWDSYIDAQIMAEKYGVSKQTVLKHAERLGLNSRTYWKKDKNE